MSSKRKLADKAEGIEILVVLAWLLLAFAYMQTSALRRSLKALEEIV